MARLVAVLVLARGTCYGGPMTTSTFAEAFAQQGPARETELERILRTLHLKHERIGPSSVGCGSRWSVTFSDDEGGGFVLIDGPTESLDADPTYTVTVSNRSGAHDLGTHKTLRAALVEAAAEIGKRIARGDLVR